MNQKPLCEVNSYSTQLCKHFFALDKFRYGLQPCYGCHVTKTTHSGVI